MMNGSQYKESLKDGRATYFEGERVDDLVGHPVLGRSVETVAQGYDRWYSPEPGALNPLMAIPASAEELRDRIPLLHGTDILTHVTYQSIMTLTTAASRIAADCPRYVERIGTYVDSAQQADVRITECITDAKGIAACRPASRTTPTCTRAWWSAATTAS